ncbi:MAG: hypothetical protein PHP08_00950 [Candidatus Dojkabacteria bacterium]|nr:hypothetical protein [Candidatus Dojkabacteria bacterium]
MKIKTGWFAVMIVSLVVLALLLLLVLPRAFDKRWIIWGEETSSSEVSNDPEPWNPSRKNIADPIVGLFLNYPDIQYTYLPQQWDMEFGSVFALELTGPGFERINEEPSDAGFIVPDGFYAIVYLDGLGEEKGYATFPEGYIATFDKGNPTEISGSIFLPPGTIINVSFAGNDSSGILVILSQDKTLLQNYVNYFK